MQRRVKIGREFHFEAAHFIPGHKGACANLHGHTYQGEVTVSSGGLDKMGMVMDYGDLKKIINELIVDRFDHSNLNDTYGMPTAEIMVLDFFMRIEVALTHSYPGVRLERVELRETQHSRAVVEAEDCCGGGAQI